MLVLAYNATPHSSTGFSPHYLLFGRSPRLPVDNAFPRDNTAPKQIEEVREALEWAWAKAAETDKTSKDKNKQYYDRKIRGATLGPGDRVLVKEVAFDGPHKLKDKWSTEIYEIIRQASENIPVYKIRPCNGGKIRTLHRNLLLPVQLLRDPAPQDKAPVPQMESPNPEVHVNVEIDSTVEATSSRNEESDEEEEEQFVTVVPEQSARPHNLAEPQDQPTAIHDPPPRQESQDQPTAIHDPPPTPEPPPTPYPTTPAPRASTRRRQPPSWQTSGDFVMDPAVDALVALLPHNGIDAKQVTEAIIALVIQRSGTTFPEKGGLYNRHI